MWTAWAGDNVWASLGPDGGGAKSLVIDPLNPDTVYALTIAGLRWLGRKESDDLSLGMVTAGNLIAFTVCLPLALPVARWEAPDLAVIGYLGVFQIGLAYVCISKGIRKVPAFEASSLLLIEPALNPLWAWLVHGESPSAWALAGGGLILAATLVKSRSS